MKGNPLNWAFGVGVDEVGRVLYILGEEGNDENTPIELRFQTFEKKSEHLFK